MKMIHIPVKGDIELVDVPLGEWDLPEIFTGSLIERVRFGIPLINTPYLHYETPDAEPSMVVMLVDENGMHLGLPRNRRASLLYQGGRHTGSIYGDAYLCMEVRDNLEGDTWSPIVSPHDDPEFWTAMTS
jgi:hypothetical protein